MAPKKKMLRARTTRVRRVLALRVGGRIYSTALTPDRKAGGYTVRVSKLPGCITEGDTLAEAKRMARDAISLWLHGAPSSQAKVRVPTRLPGHPVT